MVGWISSETLKGFLGRHKDWQYYKVISACGRTVGQAELREQPEQEEQGEFVMARGYSLNGTTMSAS